MPDQFPHNLSITTHSESEDRRITELVELLEDRRRLEFVIARRLEFWEADAGWIFADGPLCYGRRPVPTFRQAIDLAMEILGEKR